LRGQAAFAGGIDYQHQLAGVIGEVLGLAIKARQGEIGELGHQKASGASRRRA
jgi:hypothetical protein